MQIPKRRPGKYGGPEDNFLTPERIEALKSELRRLEEFDRPKAVNDMRVAAEMGDRSENAAYTEARGRLTGIDARIFALKEKIKFAIPIERGAGEGGRAAIGSTVVVSLNGREKTYEIVGSQETNPGRGRISYLSPLGSALLGKKAGDEVAVETGRQPAAYLIISVS